MGIFAIASFLVDVIIITHRHVNEREKHNISLCFISSLFGQALRIYPVLFQDEVFDCQSECHCSKTAPQGTLFAIHNHPHSTPPSGSDFSASMQRDYAGAIVALHDGEVYFYKHGHMGFSAKGFGDAVQTRMDKGLTETEATEAVMAEYAERFGLQWKRLR